MAVMAEMLAQNHLRDSLFRAQMARMFLRKTTENPVADLAGPTDAEVLASDLRLRRTLGGSKTSVTGGLAGSQARITMPTLVGT